MKVSLIKIKKNFKSQKINKYIYNIIINKKLKNKMKQTRNFILFLLF